ncbi:MAG: ATP-binding protein [Vicinamibacterales bacterium]
MALGVSLHAPDLDGHPPVPRRVRPGFEAVVAVLSIVLVSTLGLALLYRFARAAQLDAVRGELMQLARVAATRVDGDLHRTLESPEKEGTPDHLRALEPLATFHKATKDIIYVYTAVRRNDHIYFVLDPTVIYHDPVDTLPPDPIMTLYEGADRAMTHALDAHAVDANDDVVVEKHRAYMSAFAPFYDSRGEFVGIVGVDMWVRDLEARLASLWRMMIAAMAATWTLAVALGVVVFRWRRAAAAALARDQQAARELAAARDAAERHAAEAEQASRAKTTFLAMMSHELRTPLNAVLGYSELIEEELRDRDDAVVLGDLDKIKHAGRHLVSIISDILDYSKIEAGRVELERMPLEATTILEEVRSFVEPLARAKGLVVTTSGVDVERRFEGDPTRLRQVLLNLAGNAVKFTETGAVGLAVSYVDAPGGPRVHFAVSDTGLGIPEERQSSLFKPFTQIDASTTRRFGGTGLGLVISQRLAHLMGGSIRVESALGMGSTFTLDIPAPSCGERSAA